MYWGGHFAVCIITTCCFCLNAVDVYLTSCLQTSLVYFANVAPQQMHSVVPGSAWLKNGLGGVVEGMADLSIVAGGAEVSTGGGQVGEWADNYFKVKHFTCVVSTCTCTCAPWWGRLCTVVVW